MKSAESQAATKSFVQRSAALCFAVFCSAPLVTSCALAAQESDSIDEASPEDALSEYSAAADPNRIGGTSPTGCKPNPNGFSARNMWRTGGSAVQYIYYPTQPRTCGDDRYYKYQGQNVKFIPGRWHTVEHRIVMNTPGKRDGVLQAWVDGKVVMNDTTRLWRNAGATYAIDALYFSTFFGGGSQPWASPKTQYADFDELVVATGRIN